MLQKYLLRVVGALCILSSLALIFTTSFIEIDGIRGKAWREFREDTENITDAVEESFLNNLEDSGIFEEELEDCDLPHTRSKMKSLFKEVDAVAEIITSQKLALKDVLVLSLKAPTVINSVSAIADSSVVSRTFFTAISRYIVEKQSRAGIIDCSPYDRDVINATAEMYMKSSDDTIESVSELSPIFIGLTAALCIFAALGVISAITHILNKGRWVKYLYLVLMFSLVVGITIAAPALSDMITDSMMNTSNLKDLVLTVSMTPYIAVALAIVPVVLDIIFERKKY